MAIQVFHLFTSFLLVLIMTSNYMFNLLPCPFQKWMKKTMWLKHLFAFLTMVVFVIYGTVHEFNVRRILLYTLLLYTYFVVLVKTDMRFFLATLLLLFLSYLVYIYQEEKFPTSRDEKSPAPVPLQAVYLDYTVRAINLVALLLTIVGCLVYMGQKKMTYGRGFRYVDFFLGKVGCHTADFPRVSVWTLLGHAFD